MGKQVIRFEMAILRVQQGNKTFRIAQPDRIIRHDTEGGIRLSVVAGEDAELSVGNIVLYQCPVHE